MTGDPKAATIMKAKRSQAGITQRALARMLGVKQPNISVWEAGAKPIPLGRAIAIAGAIGHDDPATLQQLWAPCGSC